ncbi:MAG: DUF4394 domain-containing protein [Saprospiraceae bacterium]|nr:DUF4394 domain-containing protein [Saprospiraceae bacterium]
MEKFHLFLFAAILAIVSCTKEDPSETLTPGPDQIVYAINASNQLIQFNAKNPASALSKIAISGLVSGEKLLSIDFRPSTGELYAISDSSKLYIINQTDGKARTVGSGPLTPAIKGQIVSIDFNPTVDRLRLVTSAGQNLRLNPETAAVAATDGAINGGASPVITGIAYTNSKAGAASTILYDIDQSSGKLYTQIPPNNGTLVEVGSLGISFTGQAAFDISPGNVALMAAESNFFILDLSTGKASKIGSVSEPILDIAISTDPIAYATDAGNNLIMFNPSAISAGITTKAITGLQVGENVLGIDFRPLNGQLYALGSSSRLYTINLSSGAATQVGTGIFSTLLLGTDFAFDFNPTVDRIRVVSNLGQNLRLNPIDGTVASVDGNLNPGLPMVTAAAYTNNFAGSTATSLLVVDHISDKLYIQNPPNNGTLVEIGNLGIDLNSDNGFDIGSRSNNCYLVATVGGTTNLYTINISSGVASSPIIFPSSVKGFSLGTGF